MNKALQEKYKKSLEMLAEIMEPMNDIAMAQSQFRCPYKNKNDRCTAKFGCRNQRKQEAGKLMLCVADDKLDYRSFWETELADTER